ncbi:MAG TPA: hypothetical protein ENK75_02295 [Saprospiraceae bacterium]|nr:hypothetical protein [Saprospiraceae bacterium]
MIGKVKNLLGIESVKIEIDIPDRIPYDISFLAGKIIVSSKSKQTIKKITIKLIERYVRGRGKNKLINEYTVGIVEFSKPFKLEAGKSMEFSFKMPIKIVQSEMDKIGSKNFVSKGFVKIMKKLNNVKSQFRIEATAKVARNAIPPLTKKEIKVIF